MAGQVKPLREGSHSITPHLIVNDGKQAVAFYQNAFGATVLGAHYTPEGRLMHAELKIGDSMVMVADEFPGMSEPSPKSLGGTTVVINLYSDNIDALFDKAVKAGAMVTMPLANQFWGDRYGQVKDPFGHKWALGQHIEDVSPEEMERRSKEVFAQMAGSKQ